MVTTFCLSGSAIIKAGLHAPKEISGGSLLGGDGTTFAVDEWINQAESTINVRSRNNWTDTYATLNNDVKKIIEDVASSLAAINIVNYDLNSYPSRVIAEDIINIQRDIVLRGISILKDKKQQDFIDGA